MRRAAFSACISSSCCWRRFWRHSSSISLRWSAAMPTAPPPAARSVAGLCPCPCAPLSPAGGASGCPLPVKTPRGALTVRLVFAICLAGVRHAAGLVSFPLPVQGRRQAASTGRLTRNSNSRWSKNDGQPELPFTLLPLFLG